MTPIFTKLTKQNTNIILRTFLGLVVNLTVAGLLPLCYNSRIFRKEEVYSMNQLFTLDYIFKQEFLKSDNINPLPKVTKDTEFEVRVGSIATILYPSYTPFHYFIH